MPRTDRKHPSRRSPQARTGATFAAALTVAFGGGPAQAQLLTFDPTNLIQNALTAARELQQIDNQVTQIANQIQSLANEAKNLERLGQTFTPDILARLRQMDAVIDEAGGIALKVADTRAALGTLYTGNYAGTSVAARALAASQQIDASRQALRRDLVLEAQAEEELRADQASLQGLDAANANAAGALSVAQATNSYLAFSAEQNMRLQNLLLATSRASALEAARALEARAQGQAEHDHFFGSALTADPGARPWN